MKAKLGRYRNRLTRINAPRPSPTPMAAGRFRPAREPVSSAGCSGAADVEGEGDCVRSWKVTPG
jgi:hypothetical protein